MRDAPIEMPPRARILMHPGPFNPVRIQSLRSPSARHVRLMLQPGRTLYESLVQPLASIGITSASTTILGGYFDQLEYCVAIPDPARRAVIKYSAPIPVGRGYMVFGNATLGFSLDGTPLVHCHATVRSEAGVVKGGHILTETCVIGGSPIAVLVTSLDGFELRQTFDPETNIPLLQPKEMAHV